MLTTSNRARIVTVLLALAILACNAPGQSQSALPPTVTPDTSLTQTGVAASPTSTPAQPTATTGPTAASQATQPPATQGGFTPPNAPAPNAGTDDKSITFHIDFQVMPQYEWAIVPADAPASGAPEAWLVPSHYAFTFPKYPVSNTYQPPRILVFPIKNFENYNQTALDEITRLKTLLAQKPTQFDQTRGIPVVPIFNAAQVFRAHVEYMNFQNGTGIRFITQYDQYPPPINNAELFYTFQGITNDGVYYVAAFFPISHPSLPADSSNPDPAVGSDFNSYIAKVTAALDAAPVTSFTPGLQALDGMILSLKVK